MGIDLSGNVDGIVQTVFDRGAYPHYFLGSESKRKQIYAEPTDFRRPITTQTMSLFDGSITEKHQGSFLLYQVNYLIRDKNAIDITNDIVECKSDCTLDEFEILPTFLLLHTFSVSIDALEFVVQILRPYLLKRFPLNSNDGLARSTRSFSNFSNKPRLNVVILSICVMCSKKVSNKKAANAGLPTYFQTLRQDEASHVVHMSNPPPPSDSSQSSDPPPPYQSRPDSSATSSDSSPQARSRFFSLYGVLVAIAIMMDCSLALVYQMSEQNLFIGSLSVGLSAAGGILLAIGEIRRKSTFTWMFIVLMVVNLIICAATMFRLVISTDSVAFIGTPAGRIVVILTIRILLHSSLVVALIRHVLQIM